MKPQELANIDRSYGPWGTPAPVLDLPALVDRMRTPDALGGRSRIEWRGRSVSSVCGGAGVRFETRTRLGERTFECVSLAPGVLLTSFSAESLQPVTVWQRQDGSLFFSLIIQGGYRSCGVDGSALRVAGPAMVGVAHPKDCEGYSEPFPATRHEMVSLLFRDAQALAAFGAPLDLLPQGFLAATASAGGLGSAFLGAPEREALRAGAEILNAPYDGTLRKLYLEAKARELLCHIIATHRLAEGRHAINALDGANRNHLAQRARCLLERDPMRRFCIDDLATQCGVHRNKLMREFRTTFGVTVQDFSRDLRLREARRMLAETTDSVIEIALSAGYEQHSSFTTAYKRLFGETPSETRSNGDLPR